MTAYTLLAQATQAWQHLVIVGITITCSSGQLCDDCIYIMHFSHIWQDMPLALSIICGTRVLHYQIWQQYMTCISSGNLSCQDSMMSVCAAPAAEGEGHPWQYVTLYCYAVLQS